MAVKTVVNPTGTAVGAVLDLPRTAPDVGFRLSG
jgi:hypothetical protein